MNKTIIFSVIGFLAASTIAAQDIHFSQVMESPVLLSPANTGFFNGYKLWLLIIDTFTSVVYSQPGYGRWHIILQRKTK